MQKGSTVLRQDIADILQENALGEGQFAGEQIMPIMPVGAKAGQFAKLAFSTVKTVAVDDKRASSGNYNEVTHEIETDTYTCFKRGLEEPVDDDDAILLGSYFDAETSAADLCRYYLRLNREARIAAIAFSGSVMASYTAAATTPWSTIATATPVDDISKAKENMLLNINGMYGAGAKIIGVGNLTAKRYLLNCTDIKDRHFSGGNVNRKEMTNEELAAVLGLDDIVFSGLKRGGSSIWDATKFGIYVTSPSTQLRSTPVFGKTMLWRDSTPTDMMVETYRDDTRESEIVKVKHNSVEKLITARAGYLLTSVTA